MSSVQRSRSSWNSTYVVFTAAVAVTCFFVGRHSLPQTPQTSSDQSRNGQGVIETGSANDHPLSLYSEFESPAAGELPKEPASNDSWSTLVAQAKSPARDKALIKFLEDLATRDPARAIALAQAESNPLLREQLVKAALLGWGKVAPSDAAEWALSVPPPEAREGAIFSVFNGAVAANPEGAIALGKRLAAEHPGEAVGFGGHLIDLLCGAGNFEAASRMAVSGNAGQAPFWLGEAYAKWAEYQPQQAAQSAANLGDPEMRKLAMRALVSGWTQTDPNAAVQFVVKMPDEELRNSLVGPALQRWAKLDPKAASEWIDSNELGGAMDQGVASVATMEGVKSDVALSWAESVVDPKLRSETLVTVLRNFATSDLPAVQEYLAANKNLLPEDRQEIAQLLDTLSGQAAGK